jgi:pimeloyl-ACP methyl ester carboxylesterase
MDRLRAVAVALLLCVTAAAHAQSTCDPDGTQSSGSKYRICMPPAAQYNGNLVIWAHGFQDAGTPVSIPQDQLCLSGLCVNDIANALGYGFATNSYSKTGLAVLQGAADIVDLVNVYTAQKGRPNKVYLVGASEGGLITTLNLERRPDVFSAGLALCGPVGSFPLQINYFGDARATFEYFFPGLIPGDPFNPSPTLAANWYGYYQANVKPVVMSAANRGKLDQWVAVANLPYDAADYLGTVEQSVYDVLRYSVVNLVDAANTIGGFPFDNTGRWYAGSGDDLALNLAVLRKSASPAAITEMTTKYDTTGSLSRPLITMHTTGDQQVPYLQNQIYTWKSLFAGSLFTHHLPFAINRYEHCNFTAEELLFGFIVMLIYDGAIVP